MNNPIEDFADNIVKEIKSKAISFCFDNFDDPKPIDFITIETAMLIGSCITLEHYKSK